MVLSILCRNINFDFVLAYALCAVCRALPAHIQGVRSLGYVFLIVIYKHTFFRWRRNETHFYANNIISNSLKDLALTRAQSGSFEHVFGPANATRMRKYYKYSKFLYANCDCDVCFFKRENQVHASLVK